MWPFRKNRYKKLKREEVVEAIIELDNREEALEKEIAESAAKEKALLAKGRQEANRDIRLLYAKKIEAGKKERQDLLQRSLYLLYNLQLLKKLKSAIDDKEFIQATSDVSLIDLLADQKNLAKFLNGALQTKVKAEDIMTSADDVFKEVSESYAPNEKIYGVNESDDQLLAMFEEAEDEPSLNKEEEGGNTDVDL